MIIYSLTAALRSSSINMHARTRSSHHCAATTTTAAINLIIHRWLSSCPESQAASDCKMSVYKEYKFVASRLLSISTTLESKLDWSNVCATTIFMYIYIYIYLRNECS